jgi:hypothetical protein
VGVAAGQFAHQVIRLRIYDVSIGRAGVAQSFELCHDGCACILTACNGPNFLPFSKGRHFGNRAKDLCSSRDLTGF